MKTFPIVIRVIYFVIVLLVIHLCILGCVNWGGGANTTTKVIATTFSILFVILTYVIDVLFARYIIYKGESLAQMLIIYIFGYLNILYVQASMLYSIALLGGWIGLDPLLINDAYNCFYSVMLPQAITLFNTAGAINVPFFGAAVALWGSWITISGVVYISFLLSIIASRVSKPEEKKNFY